MPRRPRELEDGGIYHLFNRGNNRMELFGADRDYRTFLDLVREAKKRFPADIFHYCVMPNHFHFLLRISRGLDLPRWMHRIQLGYARYFMKLHGFVGHVFQQRFRSPRIAEESYYLQCGRYIERNPVKAGLVKEAADYRYSSARFYVRGETDELVTPNVYYEEMGETDAARKENYRKFLAIDEPYGAIVDRVLAKV